MADAYGPGGPMLWADAVAGLEVGMAAMLVVGAFLVRRGHVRAHKYIQSSMVLLNVPIVLIWMVPHYWGLVLPDLPSELSTPYYLFPTLMLFAGSAAELLGIFILLVAGTSLIPERFRFRRYKLWMRTELILWWGVVTLGLTTYYVWYFTS